MKTAFTGFVVVAVISVAACDTGEASQAPKMPTGSFIQVGDVRRLNLRTPQAIAQVIYRDSIQAIRASDGRCVIGIPPKVRLGLGFTLGEVNVKTCAGVLYYFAPASHGSPPTRSETTYATGAPPEG